MLQPFLAGNLQQIWKTSYMKHMLFFIVLLFGFVQAKSQLKVKPECATLVADIYKGTVNGAKPNDDPEQIKLKLPCFTSFQKEGNESKCGGGIYYADKGMTVFIQRDYFLFDQNFKGSFSVKLMGTKQGSLFSMLGNPKLKDANWEAYQMAYGTLILYFNTAKQVNKVIMSTKTTDDIQLCE